MNILRRFSYFLLPLLAGAGIYFAQPPRLMPGLSLVCLLPIFWLVEKSRSKTASFLIGFLTGAIFFGLLMRWIFSVKTNEISTLNESSNHSWFLIIFYIAMASIGASSIGFWSLLMHTLKALWSSATRVILISFAIVFCEYFKSILASFFLAGKESLVGPHWTFGHLGYGLLNYDFLSPMGSLGGIYLLSFYFVLLNGLIYLVSKTIVKKSKAPLQSSIIVLGILIILPIISIGLLKINKPSGSFKTAIVQTKKGNSQSSAKALNDLIKTKLTNSDLIILPENIEGKAKIEFDTNQGSLSLVPGQNQLLVYSQYTAMKQKDGQVKRGNNVFYVNGSTKGFHTYSKTFLMPFGEYKPYLLALAKPFSNVESNRKSLSKGKVMRTSKFNNHYIGALVCGAFLSPSLSQMMVAKGNAEVVINLSSNHLFGENEQFRMLNLAYLRMRAIETGRYYIQAANEGYSFVINEKGQTIKILKNHDFGLINSDIKLYKNRTPFSIISKLFRFIL